MVMISGTSLVAIQRRTIGTLSATQVLAGVAVAGAVAAGGLLAAEISGSEQFAGVSQTFGILGAAICALPLARLSLTRGRRVALTTGYLLGTVGAVLVVLAAIERMLPLLLVGSLLVGAATAAGYQARYAATDLAADTNRGRALSYVVWAATIGAVLGPNLLQISSSLGRSLGIPPLAGPYIVCFICLAAASVVMYVFLRPDPFIVARDLRSAVDPESKREASHPRLRDGLGHLRQHPRAMLGVATIAIGHVAMVSVMVMTPIHMHHVDVSMQFIGLVISVHLAGMYALSPLVGYALDRLGRIAVLYAGVGILLVACLVAALAPADSVLILGIGLFLLGLGWSCTLITGSVMVTDGISEVERPAVQGLSDLTMNAAGAIGGVVAGFIVAFGSYPMLCLLSAIPVLALGVFAAIPACRQDSYTRSG
jgi:MFS family permease